MGEWVVKNGDWYLSEGPSWAVSTWVADVRQAASFPTRLAAEQVAVEAIFQGHRPFGCPPDGAKAAKKTAKSKSLFCALFRRT